MSFVLSVPNSFCTHWRKDRPRTWFDGYVAKESGQWSLTNKLKKSHRWKTKEKAEAALILIGAKLPDIIGKVVIVEVIKEGETWARVRSHRDW